VRYRKEQQVRYRKEQQERYRKEQQEHCMTLKEQNRNRREQSTNR
jgi:hypothetical protein